MSLLQYQPRPEVLECSQPIDINPRQAMFEAALRGFLVATTPDELRQNMIAGQALAESSRYISIGEVSQDRSHYEGAILEAAQTLISRHGDSVTQTTEFERLQEFSQRVTGYKLAFHTTSATRPVAERLFSDGLPHITSAQKRAAATTGITAMLVAASMQTAAASPSLPTGEVRAATSISIGVAVSRSVLVSDPNVTGRPNVTDATVPELAPIHSVVENAAPVDIGKRGNAALPRLDSLNPGDGKYALADPTVDGKPVEDKVPVVDIPDIGQNRVTLAVNAPKTTEVAPSPQEAPPEPAPEVVPPTPETAALAPAPEVAVSADSLRTKTLEMLIASDARWTNRAKLIERFLDEGYTLEQAFGVIGNFAVEAAGDGLNPAIEQGGSEADPKRANGKGGPGRGIGQWGSNVDKYDRFGFKLQSDGTHKEGTLQWFAAQSGRSWEDADVQIDFTLWELDHTQQGARKTLKAATTVEEASANFMNDFERPKVRDASPRTAAALRSLEAYNATQVEARKALAPPPAPAPVPQQPAPETAPAPVPAGTACAAGTESLGMLSGWKNVQKEFCAVNELPSSSSESKPGNTYYVEGANGRSIVSAEHSSKIVRLIALAKQDGITLETTSSYRSKEHQAVLCAKDKRCSKGDTKAVAAPGGSWHNETAFDFKIPGYINATSECNNGFVASNGVAVCATPEFSPVAAWLMKNAPEVGLTQYVNEFWHYDPRPTNTQAGAAVNEYRNMVLNSQEAKDIPNHPGG